MPHYHSRGVVRLKQTFLASAVVLMIGAGAVGAQESESTRSGPRDLFSTPLPDMPGMHLEVVELVYPPKSGVPSTPENYQGQGHHHPGSVYVYVTEGAIRIGVEGQPVTVVEAGGSFFEPPNTHHMFTESANATKGARAIAVMVVPDGAQSVIRGKYER